MSGLIPIPEADTYGITLLIVFSLASFSVSAHLYSRWLAERGRSFIAIHCWVLAAISVWGLLILGPEGIVSRSAIAGALTIPVGIGCGIFAVWSDRAIVRGLSRRRLLLNSRRRSSPAPRTGRYSETRAVTRMTPVSSGTRVVRSRGVNPGGRDFFARPEDSIQTSLWLILLVAVLEELVFRGFIVQASLLLPHPALVAGAILASVVMFALSHLSFGWAHVAGKLPLGIVAALSVVALGTVAPAIIAHGLFNYQIWRDYLRQPRLARAV